MRWIDSLAASIAAVEPHGVYGDFTKLASLIIGRDLEAVSQIRES